MRILQMSNFILNICKITFTQIVLVGLFPSESLSGNAANAIDHFTPEKIKALGQFRTQVKNILYVDYQHTDIYLIRWLQARNLDSNRAKEMLVKNLNWRKENNIDDIRNDKDMHRLHKKFPFTTNLRAKDGSPVGEYQLPRWDLRKIMIAGKREMMARYAAYYQETMFQLTLQLNQTNYIFLMDSNGLNTRQHICLTCLPFYLDFVISYENNYPNLARPIIVVNSPRIFEGVLQIVRPVLSPSTRETLKIFGSNKAEYQLFLLDIFEPNQLPKRLGGTSQNI